MFNGSQNDSLVTKGLQYSQIEEKTEREKNINKDGEITTGTGFLQGYGVLINPFGTFGMINFKLTHQLVPTIK